MKCLNPVGTCQHQSKCLYDFWSLGVNDCSFDKMYGVVLYVRNKTHQYNVI